MRIEEKKILRAEPLLFLILGFGFFLRIVAVHFGLPFLYHADEPIVVNHALAFGAGDFNPHFFKIPPLLSYLLFFCYGTYYLFGRFLGLFKDLRGFEFLFYANPTSFYLLARLIFGVAVGTATIYLFYRLISRHFSKEKALLSAFLLSVCFLHVRDSHYAYPDIPLLLILVSSFFIFFKLMEGGGLSSHASAGGLIGLAAGMKYNGLALAIPYFYSWLLGQNRLKIKGLGLAAASGCLLYFLTNPYSLMDAGTFIREIKIQAQSQGGVGWNHPLTYSLAGGLGLPLLTLSLLGMFQVFRNFDRKKFSFLIFVLTYYLILIRAGQPYDRYVLPLLPFLIFFSADFVSSLRLNRMVLFLVISLMALPNLLKSYRFDQIMLEKDTRTLAKEWVEKNLASGTRLALVWDFYMPRLDFSREQLEAKKKEAGEGPFRAAQLRKLDYLLSKPPTARSYRLYFLTPKGRETDRFLFSKPTLPFDLQGLREQGIQYVLVPRLQEHPEPKLFYDELARCGRPVAEFNPYLKKAGRKWAYDPIALTGGPFLFFDLWLRERNGPLLQIYQLSQCGPSQSSRQGL